jgi:hypothetical protein
MENLSILEKAKEQKNLFRITVNKEGERALAAIVELVNDGFIGGKVNRMQMANWVLIKFNENINEDKINKIRGEHFDEVAVLESILRQAKGSGQVPSEFKSLLQKQVVMSDGQKKRNSKKVLTTNDINDDI